MISGSPGDQSAAGRWIGVEPTLLCLAVFFVLLTLGLQTWPGASGWLRFDRASYERGAVWQLLTSQWVHLSIWHAASNAFALAVIVVASGFWLRWPLQLLALCGGYAGVALVLALDPDCSYYAGASGALHGLLAGNAVAVAWLARPLNLPTGPYGPAAWVAPSAWIRRLAVAALGLMALKLWLQAEGLLGAPLGGWSFPVYQPAHIAGALGGMGLVLLFLAARTRAATKVQAEPGQRQQDKRVKPAH